MKTRVLYIVYVKAFNRILRSKLWSVETKKFIASNGFSVWHRVV
jgi:hypothetical protein